MIEYVTLAQAALGDAKARKLGRWPFQAHGDVAQAHRFAGPHSQHQGRFLALAHIGADAAAVIAKRLQRFLSLTLRHPAVAQQLARIPIAQVADVVFDILPQRAVFRLDPYVQLGRAGLDAAQHQDRDCGYQQADSVRFTHGAQC